MHAISCGVSSTHVRQTTGFRYRHRDAARSCHRLIATPTRPSSWFKRRINPVGPAGRQTVPSAGTSASRYVAVAGMALSPPWHHPHVEEESNKARSTVFQGTYQLNSDILPAAWASFQPNREISTNYRAVCGRCGHEGLCVRRYNEVGSPTTEWVGFRPLPGGGFHGHDVKHPAGSVNAMCTQCGAKDVRVKEPVMWPPTF